MAWKPSGRRMRRALLLAALTATMLVAAPSSASALATLSGQVYFAHTGICLPPCKTGVPNMTVEIRTSADAIVKTVFTAADGTWSTTVFGSVGGFDYHVYVEGMNVPAKYAHLTPATGVRT